ncbi:MAG: DNA cytosine methyltransferase [Planctomycetota bacterium]
MATTAHATHAGSGPSRQAVSVVNRGRFAEWLAPRASADFFSGIGLMSMGLSRAGWRPRWANDYDAKKRLFYEHNARAVHGDGTHTLDPRPVQQIRPKDVPRVGLMAACFPCTDLSLAGAQRGLVAGPQSSAFLHFADLLDELGDERPPFVLLENVVGLVTSHGGADFELCLRRLAHAGYRIDAMAINAKHFVPQSRPRLFVLGVRDDAPGLEAIAAHGASEDELRPTRLAGFRAEHSKLPWICPAMPALPRVRGDLVSVLENFEHDDARWWSDERVRRLRAQVSERHQTMVRERVRETGVACATAFRRMRRGRSMAELRFDGIAGCLRTPKGGSAKQILVRVDREGWRARLLTPTECARLMGADGFDVAPPGTNRDDALFGFGDAVAPPVVRWVVEGWINPLAQRIERADRKPRDR